MGIVRDRFLLPFTYMIALRPLHTTLVTVHGPVRLSCADFGPLPGERPVALLYQDEVSLCYIYACGRPR